MSNYKADTTLNERDSLIDMLNVEKELVKMYSTCITEGVSKGFRTTVKSCLEGQIDSQFNVFSLLTELDYASVTSADEQTIQTEKEKFCEIKNQLN